MAVKDELAAVDARINNDDTALDKLVHDSDPNVRVMVAKAARPQDLDILVLDDDKWVRAAVARYGRLEDRKKLADDPDPIVRAQVVRGGKQRREGLL